MLIVRWLISALVLGYVLGHGSPGLAMKCPKSVALLVGCVGGVVMTLVWRQKFCDFVGDLFASLYSGRKRAGGTDPVLFHRPGAAQTGPLLGSHRAGTRATDAFSHRFHRLDAFGRNPSGGSQRPRQRPQYNSRTARPKRRHAPKNIAFALSREADWLLKLAQDREGARAALEQIVQLLPETEQAQLALQRIAHLVPTAMLVAKKEPQRFAVPKGEENLGLRGNSPEIKAPEQDPAWPAAEYVRHLEEYPSDNEAREKLRLHLRPALPPARSGHRPTGAVDRRPNQPPSKWRGG